MIQTVHWIHNFNRSVIKGRIDRGIFKMIDADQSHAHRAVDMEDLTDFLFARADDVAGLGGAWQDNPAKPFAHGRHTFHAANDFLSNETAFWKIDPV